MSACGRRFDSGADIIVLVSGRWITGSGSTAVREMPADSVFSAEMRIGVKTMRRQASARPWAPSVPVGAASGRMVLA